jgi:pyruvate/2-oxoglutarate dehydrogenase complex dihydrolipoamide dehydrogenase (E3) component
MADQLGLRVPAPEVDFAAAIARKDRIIEGSRSGIRANLTEKHDNITLLEGRARFLDAGTISVALPAGEQQLTAPLIFINTGTHAAIPDIDGIADSGYLTNDTLLDLKELPEHLLILGGSYIGVEFGQMFRRLGSRVTIIDHNARVMSREDPDVSDALQELLAQDGIEFIMSAKTQQIERTADGLLTLTVATPAGEHRPQGTHLLIAVGREPNTQDFGLEQAGIETDEEGYIKANERLETSVSGVYALGDVKGGPQFTHISYDDYRIVRDNLLHDGHRTTHDRPVPYVVFTEPQLGRIGLSKAQAKEQKTPARVSRLPIVNIGRARETNATKGFIEVLVGDDDQLLGATVLTAEGGELMTMFQLAMAGKLRYQQLENMVIAHPTWAESLNNSFQKLKRM